MSPNRKSLICLAATALLALTVQATSSPFLHNPLRVRVNSELIRNVFHKRDQDILKVIQNVDLGTFALGDANIESLKVSFEPSNGEKDQFDYKLSLDQSKFIGIESDNMKIFGNGKIVHGGNSEEFTIEGPVQDFRVSFEVDQNAGSTDKKIIFKGIDLVFNNQDLIIVSTSPVFQEHGHSEELKNWLSKRLVDELHNIKTEALSGKEATIAKLPALSLAPAVGLYYAAFLAERVEFTDSYIEYEFSPVSLKLMKPKSIHPEFVKQIQTSFAPSDSSDEPSALQLIVDENLINVVIGMFLKIDTTYSVRELLALDPRLVMMRQLMTTTTIGMAIPQFKEEYGEGRPIDIVLTPSH